ncbi:MAG: hypothetical protein RLZZ200_729, partial [Pseudomonadota bacterium]
MVRLRTAFLACVGLAVSAVAAGAAFPPARNQPYLGFIRVEADVTDIQHRLIRVKEQLPVLPGRLTLLYPEWLPGNHAPRGPIDQLSGLVIRGGGRVLSWRREPTDVYAFHVDVPLGVTELDIQFDV